MRVATKETPKNALPNHQAGAKVLYAARKLGAPVGIHTGVHLHASYHRAESIAFNKTLHEGGTWLVIEVKEKPVAVIREYNMENGKDA